MATPPTGNPNGRPSEYKPEYCDQLIEWMKMGRSFWSFASQCGEKGVSQQTLSNWCQTHPDFFEARKIGMSHLLASDELRGLHGMMGKIKGFNGQLYQFVMRNRHPEHYKERIELDTTPQNPVIEPRSVVLEAMKSPEGYKFITDLALQLGEPIKDVTPEPDAE